VKAAEGGIYESDEEISMGYKLERAMDAGLIGALGVASLGLVALTAIGVDKIVHSKTTCPLEQTIKQDIDNNGEEEQVSVGVCKYDYWFLSDKTHFRVYVGNNNYYDWYGDFEQNPLNLRLEDINNDGDLDIRVNAGGNEYVLEQIQSPKTNEYLFAEPIEY